MQEEVLIVLELSQTSYTFRAFLNYGPRGLSV